MTDEETRVTDAMTQYGGSFVKALAEAYRHADADNRWLIRETWREYWNRYFEMSK